jgi:hypothetical protein
VRLGAHIVMLLNTAPALAQTIRVTQIRLQHASRTSAHRRFRHCSFSAGETARSLNDKSVSESENESCI